MTPKEAAKAIRDFAKSTGHTYEACVTLSTGETALSARIYQQNSWSRGSIIDVNADDFETLISRLNATWEEHRRKERADRIVAMALAIIKITDERGFCSEASLRLERFASDEIKALGSEAAAKADEMAGRGPFSIIHVAGNVAA